MAEIELILGADNGNPPDNLSEMYPKANRNFTRLNAEATNHEGRITAAETMVSGQETRLVTVETEQAAQSDRIDNIVSQSGDDITEIVDARLPEGGTAYATLGERLDTEHTQITSQLAEKANQTEVESMLTDLENNIKPTLDSKADKNETGWANLNTFDEPTRAIIQGMSPGDINAVLGYKNVLRENVSLGAINAERTDFLDVSTNMIDKLAMIPNLRLTATGGTEYHSSQATTPFIEVLPGQHSYIWLDRLAWYDKDKVFIGFTVSDRSEGHIEYPSNTAFFRATATFPDRIQFNKGEMVLPYEDYYIKLSDRTRLSDVANSELSSIMNTAVGAEQIASNAESIALGVTESLNDYKVTTQNGKPLFGTETLSYAQRRSRLPYTASSYQVIYDPSNKTPSQIQTDWTSSVSAGVIDGGAGIKFTADPGQLRRGTYTFSSTPGVVYKNLALNIIANAHVENVVVMWRDSGARYQQVINGLKIGHNEIIISRKDYSPSSGSWDDLTTIRIEMNAKLSGIGEIVVGKIDNYEYVRAPITFWFDDGHKTVLTMAKPIMDRFGFRGINAMVGSWVLLAESDPINNPSRLTTIDHQQLLNAGWEACNHTWSHYRLSDLNAFQVEIEMQKMLDYAQTHNYGKSAYYLVNPGGQTSEVSTPVEKQYSTLRRIGKGDNFLPIVDMYDIKCREIVGNTNASSDDMVTVDEVKKWVDDAITGNTWLIIMGHQIRTMEYQNQPLRYSSERFEEICEYINDKRAEGLVEVLTVSEALNRL